MQIEIIDVSSPVSKVSQKGKSYKEIEVTFKRDTGEIKGKKINQYSKVYNILSKATKGQAYEITVVKDGEFWNWEAASLTDGIVEAPASSSSRSSTPVKSTGNWETSEERAARQVMIVRQSSLSSAVSLLAANGGKKNSAQDVIDVAQQFEAYVMNTSEKAAAPAIEEDLDDDIPQ